MSTKTKTPAHAPKPGTVKAAHARIDKLEKTVKGGPTLKAVQKAHARLDQVDELFKNVIIPEEDVIPQTLEAIPKKYMATGRVSFPNIGGMALPKGMCLNAFVDIEFEDVSDANGVLFPPSRENVTERLKELADKQFPLNTGVVLSDISVLPAGW